MPWVWSEPTKIYSCGEYYSEKNLAHFAFNTFKENPQFEEIRFYKHFGIEATALSFYWNNKNSVKLKFDGKEQKVYHF